MANYEKPVVDVLEGTCEGVYAASGEEVCRYGQTDFDIVRCLCRYCACSGGENGTAAPRPGTNDKHLTSSDVAPCPDNMPEA